MSAYFAVVSNLQCLIWELYVSSFNVGLLGQSMPFSSTRVLYNSLLPTT